MEDFDPVRGNSCRLSVAGLPTVAWLHGHAERSERWRDSGRCVGATELEGEERSVEAASPHLVLARQEVRPRALEGGPASSSAPCLVPLSLLTTLALLSGCALCA